MSLFILHSLEVLTPLFYKNNIIFENYPFRTYIFLLYGYKIELYRFLK